MMMVRLGVMLFGICSKLVRNTRFVMDDRFSILSLLCIIKFTLTGFTIQSLYHHHCTHITIKIIAVIIHLSVSSPPTGYGIVAFVERTKKEK